MKTQDPEQLARFARVLFSDSPLPSLPEVARYVSDEWDVASCLPHLVDTDEPPFLVDLHCDSDWCLRATVWCASKSSTWVDVPHTHFGYIVTTSLTDIAYFERRYESFANVAAGLCAETTLRRGEVLTITPSTIHEVLLPPSGIGVSLSFRTRATSLQSLEYNRATGEITPRTKSASDRKVAVLAMLNNAVPIR